VTKLATQFKVLGCLLLAVIAAQGFFASLVCHVMGWLHIEPPWGRSTFLLHVGIFVVWFPLVGLANRTMRKPRRGNFEHLLAVLPKWARGFTYALFIYTLINFVWFLIAAHRYPKGEVPFALELRGFSGHWMLFYGIATLGFIALARLTRQRGQESPTPEMGSRSNDGCSIATDRTSDGPTYYLNEVPVWDGNCDRAIENMDDEDDLRINIPAQGGLLVSRLSDEFMVMDFRSDGSEYMATDLSRGRVKALVHRFLDGDLSWREGVEWDRMAMPTRDANIRLLKFLLVGVALVAFAWWLNRVLGP